MTTNSNQERKVAIIGAGGMAKEHIRAFADIAGVKIAGIHSRTRSKAEAVAKEFQIALVCDSAAELYSATKADLVVIAVPELAANPVAKACFEFPWMVFMEKPPGYNLHDARDIHAAAVEKGRKVYVGLNRRFLSSTRAAMADVSQRDEPRFIHVQDQQDPKAAAAYGHPQQVLDYWMYANSIHVIDYLMLLGRGHVRQVIPVCPWRGPDHTQTVLAKVEFSSGDVGLYEGIWCGPGPWAVTVSTPSRRWEMRPLEQASFQNRNERKLQPVEVHEWDKTFKPGFRAQAEQVMLAVNGQPSETPTLDQALLTMELIESIFGK